MQKFANYQDPNFTIWILRKAFTFYAKNWNQIYTYTKRIPKVKEKEIQEAATQVVITVVLHCFFTLDVLRSI
jgi:hypothetical protein